MTRVLRDRFDRREGPRFTRPRLVAAHAIRVGEGVRLQLLVKAQLVFHISIELISLEEEQQSSEHRTHGTLLSVRTLRLYPRGCAPRTPRHALSLAGGSLRSRGSLAALVRAVDERASLLVQNTLYVVFITRMIAPNIWENRDASTPSCFFPAVVSV